MYWCDEELRDKMWAWHAYGDDDDNDLEECDEDVGVGEAAEGEGEECGEASVENRRTSVWADQQIIKYWLNK